jgi:hypothetical protein
MGVKNKILSVVISSTWLEFCKRLSFLNLVLFKIPSLLRRNQYFFYEKCEKHPFGNIPAK